MLRAQLARVGAQGTRNALACSGLIWCSWMLRAQQLCLGAQGIAASGQGAQGTAGVPGCPGHSEWPWDLKAQQAGLHPQGAANVPGCTGHSRCARAPRAQQVCLNAQATASAPQWSSLLSLLFRSSRSPCLFPVALPTPSFPAPSLTPPLSSPLRGPTRPFLRFLSGAPPRRPSRARRNNDGRRCAKQKRRKNAQ